MDVTSPVAIGKMRSRKRGSVRAYEIEGEAVLYDLARDSVHYLNRSAWLIWNLCDGSANSDAISREVAKCFGPAAGACRRSDSIASDTILTLQNLAADGLIDLVDESPCEANAGRGDSWPD